MRHSLGRAADTVVDHHDGDGGAANDVELLPGGRRLQHVLPREPGDQGLDLFGGDADQDDRLVMLDQLGAGDHARRVDADRDLDRLARVADGVDHVRVEKHPSFQLGASIGWGSRWGALDRPQTIGARDQCRNGELRQEPPELRLGGTTGAGGSDQQEYRQYQLTDQVDADLRGPERRHEAFSILSIFGRVKYCRHLRLYSGRRSGDLPHGAFRR